MYINNRISKGAKPLSVIAAVLMLAALLIGCRHNVSTESETPPPVQKYTVTLTQSEHGTVTADLAIPSDKQIAQDTEITFTAKAETGYEVDTWTIRPTDVLIADGQSGNTTAKVKITANTTVTVTFKMQASVGTYVKVPFGTNGEKLDTYLKNNASEAHINYIEVTGLTAGALKGKFEPPSSYESSPLGNILKANGTKKVALKFGDSIAELRDMSLCFLGCTSLTQAPEIPASVTNMSFCFTGCERLVHVPAIPENVTNMSYCFSNCKSLMQAPAIPENVTNMGACFVVCTSLVQAPAIPASVTDMWYCFSHCTSLTQAPKIPAKVTNMSSCFSGCTSLEQAPQIPEKVTNMMECFRGCTSLVQAPEIPASVTDMIGCFYGCTSLTQAPQIPAKVTNMEGCFVRCTRLEQAPEIPAKVTNMKNCFYGCTSLTQAPEIPAKVTNMKNCFYGCTSLTQAPQIPAKVTNMEGCFGGCTSLTQAPEIPAKVTNMRGCFYGCASLEQTPKIPAKVTHMGWCFYGCTKLISVTLKCNYNNDKDADGYHNFQDTFKGCSSLMPGTIKVPAGQVEAYKAAAGIMGTTDDRFAKDE